MLATLASLAFLHHVHGVRADDVVPFKMAETALIVDATVNGKSVSLMFDTGFSGSVVCDPVINLGKATGKTGLRDFVGTLEAPTVKITSMLIGKRKMDVTDAEAVMMGGDTTDAYGIHCDGIMGLGIVKDEITEINFEKSCFIFHPKTHDITKRVADGKKTFLAKLLPTGHSSLEMSVEMPNGNKMTLALDTGNSFFATTHKDVLERVGLWKPGQEPKFMRQSQVASGAVDSWSARMPATKIFGIPTGEAIWDIIDRPSSSAEGDGTIGFGFLKNFNITIDYGRRRVWFENFTGRTTNEEKGDIGVSAYYIENLKRTVILRVAPDSPGDKAGLKKGDHILSIDGTDVGDIGYKRLRGMFSGAPGSVMKLAVSRQGELKRYEVARAVLVNEIKVEPPTL